MPRTRSLAELGDLFAALRLSGVPVGPREVDRLRQVFALAPSLDRQELHSLLSALLVKTPAQRQMFAALFADWCPEREADWPAEVEQTPPPLPEPEPEPAPPLAPDSLPAPAPRSSARRRLPLPVWLLLSGVALLACLLWVVRPRPVLVTPPPEPEEVSVPLPPAPASQPADLPATPVERVWFWQAHVKPFTVPRRLTARELAVLGGLPVALALLVGARYGYRFRDLTPLPPAGGYGWQPLPPPGRDDTALLSAPERRQLVWQIDHFLADEVTRRLDLPRTVAATAGAAGFVQLHFQPAVYDRGIWFWLDRQLEPSTPRAVVQELLHTLQAAGLQAQQGLFTDVPERVDWPTQPGYRPEHEEGHGRQAVVAILTDGAGLSQRLQHPLSRVATERLLRALQHWPRLCFVDCAAAGAHLQAVLAPYRLETIALEALPRWLGGLVGQAPVVARQALQGEARAWAAAVALGARQVDAASAQTLRVALGLEVSPWQSERVLQAGQDPEQCRRHINWLLGCEPPGADGLPTPDSLAGRALDWWQQRYRQAAAQRQAQENPLLPWRNTLASQRWQVEQAVLRLYRDPRGAAEALTRLANATLREEIRERLGRFAAAERAAGGRQEQQVIYLPWRLEQQSVLTRYRLRRLGFAGALDQQEAVTLQGSPRLLLAVAMLVTLGLTAWGQALYHWLRPEVPRLLVQRGAYEHPAFAAQTLYVPEPLVSGAYRVTLGSARHTVTLADVPAGAVIPVDWQWQAEPNAIALHGNTVLRAGRLAQPIRACSRDWPQRALVVIAAAFEQEVARQLAIRLLDTGSADQVLLGEHWQEALPEWLGHSQALNQQTQVLVVLPRAAEAERAVSRLRTHPGPWAVVVSEDFPGVARAFDFAETRAVGQVIAPWRVHRVQGQVLLSGGPERKDEAGIAWVHVCPGTFTMGTLAGEDKMADDDETLSEPRIVVLSGFHMTETEITRTQYGESGNTPKVEINWAEARVFCQKPAINGDLPTEAQWEYAARGGSRFPWSFGDDERLLQNYAWFGEGLFGKVHEIHQKQPNPLGLYDMHGNAWEWVQDWYNDYSAGTFVDPSGPDVGRCSFSEDKCRVLRGGSFGNSPASLRSAIRVRDLPENRGRVVGFRCVRVPPALAP
ncbi:MAG: SUMF1/EgtB/PvdO family nonheme iron enzyme [Candidatus Tectimicrobiota bacterium]